MILGVKGLGNNDSNNNNNKKHPLKNKKIHVVPLTRSFTAPHCFPSQMVDFLKVPFRGVQFSKFVFGAIISRLEASRIQIDTAKKIP